MTSITDRMAGFWRWLIEPSAAIHNEAERTQARLLAMITLPALGLETAVLGVLIISSGYAGLVYLVVLNIAVTLAVYGLSRTRHHRVGTLALVATAFGTTLAWVASDYDPHRVVLVVLPVIAASQFFTAPATTVLAFTGIVAAMLLMGRDPATHAELTLSLLFVISVSALIIIITWLRRRMEERLAASEARYRRLVDFSPVGILIHSDGVIRYANKTAGCILGMSDPSELIGRGPLEFVHPDFREIIRARMAYIQQAGQAAPAIYQKLIRLDGLPVEAEGVAMPVTYENQPAVQVILLDITERRRAEQALRLSEERYRTLFEQAQEVIILEDEHEAIVDANPAACRMLGYTRDELLTMKTSDLEAAEGGYLPVIHRPERVEHVLARCDGTRIPIEMTISPLTGPEDGLYLSIIRDISGRKQAETQRLQLAVEQERVGLLRNFIGDMSHDLMTPLTTLKTSLYLLGKTPTTDKQNRYVQNLEVQVEYLEKIIDDMLMMSKLDTPVEDEFTFEPGDLNALAGRVTAEYQPVAASLNQQLEFKADASLPLLWFDQDKLRRALANLVDNAIRYTPRDGKITVITSKSGKSAVVEIHDTGVGISPDDLPHVFERFYRAQKHRPAEGSVGLGLAISRKIGEVHGGSISVESQPGQGSIFRLWLPFRNDTNTAGEN